MKNAFRVQWQGGLGLVALCLVAVSAWYHQRWVSFQQDRTPDPVEQGVSCGAEQAPYFEALGIRTDFKTAAKIAEKENKPLVLLFSVNNVRKPGFQ